MASHLSETGELWERHYRRVYRYCLARLHAPAAAEEAARATLRRAQAELDAGRRGAADARWLFDLADAACGGRPRLPAPLRPVLAWVAWLKPVAGTTAVASATAAAVGAVALTQPAKPVFSPLTQPARGEASAPEDAREPGRQVLAASPTGAPSPRRVARSERPALRAEVAVRSARARPRAEPSVSKPATPPEAAQPVSTETAGERVTAAPAAPTPPDQAASAAARAPVAAPAPAPVVPADVPAVATPAVPSPTEVVEALPALPAVDKSVAAVPAPPVESVVAPLPPVPSAPPLPALPAAPALPGLP